VPMSVAHCRFQLPIPARPRMAKGPVNRQSALSISNRHSQSAIGNRKIGTPQSAIVNDQVRGT
jgi:hypothetical protein